MEGVQTMNDEEIRGAVIGMILGDGHLGNQHKFVNSHSNAHIDYAHSAKQREYALWKARILENVTSVRITDGFSHCEGKEYPKVRVLTKTHPMYTHLWKRFYHNGRKTIDRFLMDCLTPLGLAIWYQDEGILKNHENYLTPQLETNNFNVVEHEVMAKALADKFHIEFRANKLNAKYLHLCLRRKDREAFYNIVKPNIHPTMEYKIVDDGKVLRLSGYPIVYKCEICGCEVTTTFARRNEPNRFCRECYNKHRSTIGTTRNQYSEPRDSRNQPVMVVVC
jgi:hypothetical protein